MYFLPLNKLKCQEQTSQPLYRQLTDASLMLGYHEKVAMSQAGFFFLAMRRTALWLFLMLYDHYEKTPLKWQKPV